MTEYAKIVRAHAEKYPVMQPQDAVKLAYQSEFGGGHLITDVSACEIYLQQEYHSIAQKEEAPLIEEIGSGMVRVHLEALQKAGILPQLLAQAFIACANEKRGSAQNFQKKLAQLGSLAKQGIFGFDAEELNRYLAEYAAQGYPAVRHSEEYRRAYKPAYRVMTASYARLLPLLARIEALRQQKEHVFVAIDGMAASGKTTLAAQLEHFYGADCGVIHMDDFFLPLPLRTKERYAEPGGNIHYERFGQQIIAAMGEKYFSYERYDCATGTYSSMRQENRPIMVLEGSYSLHPYFGHPYDLCVFLEISSQEQTARILKRNGAEWYRDFEEKWIPMEQAYARAFAIREQCDFQWNNEV